MVTFLALWLGLGTPRGLGIFDTTCRLAEVPQNTLLGRRVVLVGTILLFLFLLVCYHILPHAISGYPVYISTLNGL